MSVKTKFIPFLLINIIFAAAAIYTGAKLFIFIALAFAVISGAVVFSGAARRKFDEKDALQKGVVVFLIAECVILSYLVCIISVEKNLTYDYPLDDVDDYGCYPQLFDAFKKGRLDIDTNLDLSGLEKLKNPYDYAERNAVNGNRYQKLWDHVYYDGKIYAYFGAAPVIFIYFPFYFITGKLPSDALAACILCAIASVLLILVIYELTRRMKEKPTFAFFVFCAASLPFGSLVWQILTCANFYHIAVISGICAVLATFLFTLYAERCKDGFLRKLLFALAGGSVAAIVASRPNHIFYMLALLPFLINIIVTRPNGVKSLIADIAAFAIPMAALGSLVAVYNYSRFGSVFDFGSSYQLTVADTSTYTFSLSLIPATLFHYFIQLPAKTNHFPYLAPSSVKPAFIYDSIHRYVYVSKTVGSIALPTTWGVFFARIPLKKSNKTARWMAIMTIVAVFAVAVADMVFGGVHLRYGSDIFFALTLLGVYFFLSASASEEKESTRRIIRVFACVLISVAVVVSICLTFDNERDMIAKFHPDIFKQLS